MSDRVEAQGPVEETWRIFRIMAEFVDGFETLARIGPAVAVFGSSRTPQDDPLYGMAERFGRTLLFCYTWTDGSSTIGWPTFSEVGDIIPVNCRYRTII